MSTDFKLTRPILSPDPRFTQAVAVRRAAVVVTDDHPPAVPFPHSGETTLLPKWLYIKDRNGLYLAVRDAPVRSTLTFQPGDPDLRCAFQATGSGSRYWFVGMNGNYVNCRSYKDGRTWYSCDGATGGSTFGPITATGNKVYLKNTTVACNFLSNELWDGAPVGHNYINETSLFEIVQAAIKNEITNVEYDIPNATIREAPPLVALRASVRNDSDSSLNQTLTYSYEKWKTGTWNNTAGVEIGVKATFDGGVPFVVDFKLEMSASASYSHSWGGEVGERQTVTSTTIVVVPPKKKARVTVIIKNAQIDVRFTYTQKILWSNGTSETEEKRGIYRNVDSWDVEVETDDWKDV